MAIAQNRPLFFGLYGEVDFLIPDFVHCETIESRIKINNHIIKEHIHRSLFQVIVLETGKLVFIIEKAKRVVTGPAIITIPENTLHGFKMGKTVKGKVLTLSTSFLEMLFKKTSGNHIHR